MNLDLFRFLSLFMYFMLQIKITWTQQWIAVVLTLLVACLPLNSSFVQLFCNTINPVEVRSSVTNNVIVKANTCDVDVSIEELSKEPIIFLPGVNKTHDYFSVVLLRGNDTYKYAVDWMVINILLQGEALTNKTNSSVIRAFIPPSNISSEYVLLVYRQHQILDHHGINVSMKLTTPPTFIQDLQIRLINYSMTTFQTTRTKVASHITGHRPLSPPYYGTNNNNINNNSNNNIIHHPIPPHKAEQTDTAHSYNNSSSNTQHNHTTSLHPVPPNVASGQKPSHQKSSAICVRSNLNMIYLLISGAAIISLLSK